MTVFPFRYALDRNVIAMLARRRDGAYARGMRRIYPFLLLMFVLGAYAVAVPKVHTITFGKWMTVSWQPGTGAENEQAINLKIRPLIVDGRIKEYSTGPLHDITDRLFAVRRVFRVNDSLPEDTVLRWQWQRGGWLLVDRGTGRVSAINLPDFDVLYSVASWYRDYVAYCGVSDDGKKIAAFVVQLNRRKPVLKKPLPKDRIPEDAPPDSACPAPLWQRNPARVVFATSTSEKQTFAIRGHVVDLVNDAEEEEEGTK